MGESQRVSAFPAGQKFKTHTFPKNALLGQALIYRVFKIEGAARVIVLLELLSQLATSDYTQLSTHMDQSQITAPDERMSRVLEFIHSHLDGNDELNLAATAKVACMTPQAFSHYFHKHARKKFINYVTELRIGRACGLLSSSNRTVMDISLATGFHNLSNFNRHFARLKQTTPRDYRKRAQIATH